VAERTSTSELESRMKYAPLCWTPWGEPAPYATVEHASHRSKRGAEAAGSGEVLVKDGAAGLATGSPRSVNSDARDHAMGLARSSKLWSRKWERRDGTSCARLKWSSLTFRAAGTEACAKGRPAALREGRG